SETPSGVYTILQKRREHYSNRYDNAPMPFMQRLTWDGIALHAGALPGYPASHGCVRLPRKFAEQLFEVTSSGTVVVVASDAFPPSVVTPGLFAPVDPATGAARGEPATTDAMQWFPERSPQGPLTLLLGIADRSLVVFRNGIEIGRAPLVADGLPPLGTLAFVLLAGTEAEASPVLPDQPALRWLLLQAGTATSGSEAALREALRNGSLAIPPDFARALRALLQPGATVVVTDEPLAPSARIDVLGSDEAPPAPTP
ncbi:MAG TPA: L,D-transpeptidase family protein, partial [Thermomonas sp.]|nr:L,D-transpeptidase family protein [Thermomonas sp.]